MCLNHHLVRAHPSSWRNFCTGPLDVIRLFSYNGQGMEILFKWARSASPENAFRLLQNCSTGELFQANPSTGICAEGELARAISEYRTELRVLCQGASSFPIRAFPIRMVYYDVATSKCSYLSNKLINQFFGDRVGFCKAVYHCHLPVTFLFLLYK